MNTRIFVVTAFILAASFGTPLFASAQGCTGKNVNDVCTYNGNTGTCVSVEVGTDTVLSCTASGSTTGGSGGTVGSGGTTGGSGGTVTPPGPATTLINPLGNTSCSSNGTCLSSFLTSILRLVIQIGAVVVVLMLVYVGFLFVVARGDPGKITTARTALLWTVIGALVLLGAQAIASGVQATIQALGG
ncbi:MAG: hypothetical protein WCT41_03195 [Candidatus Paceibacterota bacterium]|jgi:hypothetical protein